MRYTCALMPMALVGFLFACSNDGDRSEPNVAKSPPNLKDQRVDPATGLIDDKGLATVKKNCTVCHSPRLITQNKASREGWLETIRWMQATQNLQQFDAQTEDIILNYLAKNYAPVKMGRRAALRIDRWYRLHP